MPLDFCNGQLSNDVLNLADGQSQLTSSNSPKGRVVAILRLLRDSDRFFGVLPRELAAPLLERLGRYVLRAKVTLRLSSELAPASARRSRTDPREHPTCDCGRVDAAADRRGTGSARTSRRASPQIYAATSEQFVAQMLNLDLVDGISFHKGCYTRPGDHRPHAESRPDQATYAALCHGSADPPRRPVISALSTASGIST